MFPEGYKVYFYSDNLLDTIHGNGLFPILNFFITSKLDTTANVVIIIQKRRDHFETISQTELIVYINSL